MGCLASNNVCYPVDQWVDKSWCDARPTFVWCAGAALAEVRRPKVRKHAFLGAAFLQAAAVSSRARLDGEL